MKGSHSLFFHGGRLDDAERCFPGAPAPWLDLSTGINPASWRGEPLPHDLARLPGEDHVRDLLQAAVNRFGAATLPIAALPGSEIGLRMLGRLGLPRPWHVVTPTYRTHQAALPGATPIPAADLMAAAAGGGTVLLGNPNNPDGRLWSPAELLRAMQALADRNGLLVVDEAFADAVPGASLCPHLAVADPALVFRSFGKFYGLAGVRLGFVLGNAEWVERIAEELGAWPVSAPALAIGIAAYRDAPWAERMIGDLTSQARALDVVLARHGLATTGRCPLFRLVESERAGAVFERLGRAGILARPFDYAPHWLRLGLPGTPAGLARLDAALRDG